MPKKTRKKSKKAASKKSARKSTAKPTVKAKSKTSKKPTKRSETKAAKITKSKAAKSSKTKGKTGRSPAKPAKSKAAAKATNVPVRKVATISEGMTAPSFVLPRDGGQSVSLANFSGRKVVIFFYPRADTPGCTREAIDFSRLSNAFAASQTAVLGVSADSLRAQESFRDKHQLTVPLISDEKQEILRAYGAWGEKSMYGKTFMGVLRTTVLISANGKITRIWRNVKVDGHADEVLAAARIA